MSTNAMLHEFMGRTLRLGGSDLHVQAGARPMIRLQGELLAVREEDAPLPRVLVDKLLVPLLDQELRDSLRREGSLDFGYRDPAGVQWRVHLYRHAGGLGASFRPLSAKVQTLEALHLPPQLEHFASLHSGLVLFTGQAGSGKSTTQASLVAMLNHQYRKSIVTIEDPIEFEHASAQSLVHQREVGRDVRSYAQGIENALLERPDVLVIGELLDGTAMRLAVEAAGAGLLVFATVNAPDAIGALKHMLETVSEREQALFRERLADSLEGVVAQALVPKARGKGHVPACEILIGTPRIAGLIREGKRADIVTAMKAGKSLGMCTLDDALTTLSESRAITREAGESCLLGSRWFADAAEAEAEVATRQRRERRVTTRNLVTITLLDDQGKPQLELIGSTTDLSPQGARLELDREVPVGATMRLTLALEDRVIEAVAEVRTAEPPVKDRYGVGLKFTEISETAQRSLQDFLRFHVFD